MAAAPTSEHLELPFDFTDRDTLLAFGYPPDVLVDQPDGRTIINFNMIVDAWYNRQKFDDKYRSIMSD